MTLSQERRAARDSGGPRGSHAALGDARRKRGGEKRLRSGARHSAPRPLARQPAPLGLSEGWERDPDHKTQVASVRGTETLLSQSCTGAPVPGHSSVGILEGQRDAGTKGSPEL